MRTKAEVKEFATARGYEAKYSGKQKKWYLFRFPYFKMDIHKLINAK